MYRKSTTKGKKSGRKSTRHSSSAAATYGSSHRGSSGSGSGSSADAHKEVLENINNKKLVPVILKEHTLENSYWVSSPKETDLILQMIKKKENKGGYDNEAFKTSISIHMIEDWKVYEHKSSNNPGVIRKMYLMFLPSHKGHTPMQKKTKN